MMDKVNRQVTPGEDSAMSKTVEELVCRTCFFKKEKKKKKRESSYKSTKKNFTNLNRKNGKKI